VDDSCRSRHELDCNATRSMPVGDVKVENMTAAQAMVQIVGSLPGDETDRLIRARRKQQAKTRTEPVRKEALDATPPLVVVRFDHVCPQERGNCMHVVPAGFSDDIHLDAYASSRQHIRYPVLSTTTAVP
jgi:hypothetical protein